MTERFSPQLQIVYVANRLPWPLDDGWKRRTFAVLQGVAAEHEVVFVAPSPADADLVADFAHACGPRVSLSLAPADPPVALGLALATSLVTGRSPLSTRHYTASLAAEVVAVAERLSPTAVLYAGAFLAESHEHTPALRGLPFLVDTHNIDSHAMSRRAQHRWSVNGVAERLIARLLRAAETRVFGGAAAIFVCSTDEVKLVLSMAPTAQVHVVPNGVDTHAFTPGPWRPPQEIVELLFFGHLDYPPNVDAIRYFAGEIYPALVGTGIPFRLTVAGAGAGTDVRSLLDRLPHVTVVGKVPDIVATIHAADAVIVPLRAGGGTRLKILEALATGCPVISTAIGAEGLDVRHQEHLWIANTASDFARALEEVVARPALLRDMADAGVRLARSRYSWEAIQRDLGRVLSQAISARTAGTASAGASPSIASTA